MATTTTHTTHLLTTVDNPYDPFTQFEDWYEWDRQAGYHTPSYLDRVMLHGEGFSEEEEEEFFNEAIDDIISNDVFELYKKVSKEVETSDSDN